MTISRRQRGGEGASGKLAHCGLVRDGGTGLLGGERGTSMGGDEAGGMGLDALASGAGASVVLSPIAAGSGMEQPSELTARAWPLLSCSPLPLVPGQFRDYLTFVLLQRLEGSEGRRLRITGPPSLGSWRPAASA